MTNWRELSRAQGGNIGILEDRLKACESNWSNEVLDLTKEIERLEAENGALKANRKTLIQAATGRHQGDLAIENDKLQARVETLEGAIKTHVKQFPPYALHTLDIRNALAAKEQGESDE